MNDDLSPPPLITLTTDFGLSDPFVGVMKGVILAICPDAVLVDISHGVAPGEIEEAAWILEESIPFFPEEAVHLCVVDPGVGSDRRGIVVETGTIRLVGPDNGVFTPFLDGRNFPEAREGKRIRVVELTEPRFFRKNVSSTFHGRDIFAPVAAWLARGRLPGHMGRPVNDPFCLPAWEAVREDAGIQGRVVRVDRFGNLITNVPGAWLTAASEKEGTPWWIEAGEIKLPGPDRCYGDRKKGEPGFLVNSTGRLEIFVSGGNAAAVLGMGRKDSLRVVRG